MLIFIFLYIIRHCVIQYIYLPTLSRLSILVSLYIAGQKIIGIWFISRRVDVITTALLVSLGLDVLDHLHFTAWAGLLKNSVNRFVLLLERFQTFPLFIFELLILCHSFRPTSHGSSQSIPGGIMIRALAKMVFGNMQHIILLRHPLLLANLAVALGTVILGRFSIGLVVEYTSPSLLIPCNPHGFSAVIMIGRSSRCNLLDLGCFHFPIIFVLDCVEELTPICMSQVTIVLLVVLQLILHVWG